MMVTNTRLVASTVYFEEHKRRAIELELKYLPQFYKYIAVDFQLAHGDDLFPTVLQRKEHIDAVMLGKDGQYYYVEHKFDFYKPRLEARQGGKRNVLIETIMNTRINSPGWSVTTRADYILFAFERPEQCLDVYMVRWLGGLKEWFTEHQHQYTEYTNYNKPNPTTFRIVPLEAIQAALNVASYRVYRDGRVAPLVASPPLLVSGE